MASRGLDHIVHAVRDLDAAAEFYRRIGFTVGARNRHPWGTHNYIVQLPGTFIELLTVAEPDKLGDDAISDLFGRYNREFLARGEGLSLLILESKDAKADVAEFRRAGIAAADTVHFEREAKRPDGTPIKVGFSLAFAHDSAAPSTRFATCQQHYPENFWNPAFQVHPNSATGVAGVVLVAQDPGSHARFLAAFANAESHVSVNALMIKTPRGNIEVVTPATFLERFGVSAPDVSLGARLAALRFSMADASLLAGIPGEASIAGLYAENSTVIGREDAMGAVLVFEPSR